MGKTKPPYGEAFWADAVALATSSERTLRGVASDLGVSYEALRRHVAQARVDAGEQAGLTTDERAELTRLRRENRVLRQEREILRKAAVFFATETDEIR